MLSPLPYTEYGWAVVPGLGLVESTSVFTYAPAGAAKIDRSTAHILSSACNDAVGFAEPDLLASGIHCLHGRGTEPVDCEA